MYYEYRSNAHGVLINKYYGGVSVLQLPFFLGAHALTSISGGDTDGYSKYYMLSISIASWFYQLFGLYFIVLLLQFYQVKPNIIALVLVAISFGTNLYVYTIVEAGMSHVYSFAMVAAFLYFAHKAFVLGQNRYLLRSSLLLGLIVLLIVVCQIQSYQYRYYEIHYSEMTQVKYWDVFLLRNRF